jgi:hypothetical protein
VTAKQPNSKMCIADFDLAAQEWQVVPSEDDPAEVDL